MLTRSREWWSHRWFADPESSRDGRSEKRYLVCEIGDEPAGYAVYRQKAKWDDFVADGEVDVVEVIALHPEAHRAIWSFLIHIDLFPRVSCWNLPEDDPLPTSVGDYRRVRRTVNDALWIRLLDVRAALEARRYESDGVVTFALADRFRPDCEGVYRLEVVNGAGSCVRTDEAADLSLDTDILGHLYLGGGDARAMSAAGRLKGDPASVRSLHRMFRTDAAPWCPEVF
jgi:predicted acetyltransferase